MFAFLHDAVKGSHEGDLGNTVRRPKLLHPPTRKERADLPEVNQSEWILWEELGWFEADGTLATTIVKLSSPSGGKPQK